MSQCDEVVMFGTRGGRGGARGDAGRDARRVMLAREGDVIEFFDALLLPPRKFGNSEKTAL